MAIQRLEISNYRSLKNIVWEPGNLNVLIGPNGSGKSNLLRALMLIKNASMGKLKDAVRDSDGMGAILWDGQGQEIEISLRTDPIEKTRDKQRDALTYNFSLNRIGQSSTFRTDAELLCNRYKFEHETERDVFKFLERKNGRVILYDESQQKLESPSELYAEDETVLAQVTLPSLYPRALTFRHGINDWQIYHDVHVDLNSEMRRAALSRRETRVMPDASNLVNVLHTLYNSDRDFEDELNIAMKAAFGQEFDKLVFPPADDDRIQLRVRWQSLRREQTARDLSDGTLRYLFLITVLGASQLPPLIAIDEPEIGLHPSMLPLIAEYAISASRRSQVILTTHSAQLLNAFSEYPDIATVVECKHGETKLTRLAADKLGQWLDHYQLGELFRSGELEDMA